MAFWLAAGQLERVLSSSLPVGAHFQGLVSSVYARIGSINRNFFLSPGQIQELQATLGDAGRLVAATGVRAAKLQHQDTIHTVGLDVVSHNFFTDLAITTSSRNVDPGQAHVWLGSALVQRLYGGSTPESIQLDGISFLVAGTVGEFQGLFDQQTEVWLPWEFAHPILFSTLPDRGLLQQPEMYFAIALSSGGADAEARAAFEAGLARVRLRTDVLQPPWTEFAISAGISADEAASVAATRTIRIYRAGALLMLMAATLHLGIWAALLRSSQSSSLRTMRQLGIGPWRILLIQQAFVALPLLIALLCVVPGHILLLDWLRMDPTLAALLAKTRLQDASVASTLWAVLLLTLVVWSAAALVGELIDRLDGSSQLGARGTSGLRVTRTFRGLVALSTLTCTIGLMIAALSLHETRVQSGRIGKALDSGSGFMVISRGDAPTSGIGLERVASVLQATPEQALAVTGAVPLLTQIPVQQLGHDPDAEPWLSVQLIPGEGPLPRALGLRLLSGRGIENPDEIVLDQAAASKLEQRSQRPALDSVLFDASGSPFMVVGVVESMLYDLQAGELAHTAYVHRMNSMVQPNVLVYQQVSAQTVQSWQRLLAAEGIEVQATHALQEVAQQVYARELARLRLAWLASLCTTLVALLSLTAVCRLEAQRQQATLALYSALGASRWRRWRLLLQGLLMFCALGSALALLLIWRLRIYLNEMFSAEPKVWLWASAAAFVVMLALAVLATWSILRSQLRESRIWPTLQGVVKA